MLISHIASVCGRYNADFNVLSVSLMLNVKKQVTYFCFISFLLVCTEAVIQKCIQCGRPFRTYVPNSMCYLPDGAIVTYSEPQLTCPLCDEKSFGIYIHESGPLS